MVCGDDGIGWYAGMTVNHAVQGRVRMYCFAAWRTVSRAAGFAKRIWEKKEVLLANGLDGDVLGWFVKVLEEEAKKRG
jgi:hypothetical protein